MNKSVLSILLPVAVLLVVYFLWDGAVLLSNSDIFPRPLSGFFGDRRTDPARRAF